MSIKWALAVHRLDGRYRQTLPTDAVDVVKGSAVFLCQDGELCKVGKKWAVYVMAFHSEGGEEQRDGLVHVSCTHIWGVHISLTHPPTHKSLYWLLWSSFFRVFFLRFCATFLDCSLGVFKAKMMAKIWRENPEQSVVEDALLEENFWSSHWAFHVLSNVSPKIY